MRAVITQTIVQHAQSEGRLQLYSHVSAKRGLINLTVITVVTHAFHVLGQVSSALAVMEQQ